MDLFSNIAVYEKLDTVKIIVLDMVYVIRIIINAIASKT